jgi:predicted ATP-grasp superfamily ATP-dependent carboligase
LIDALVTDVHITSAVAGLRGLGRAGLKVLALGDRWSAAGLWSRYAAARAVGPNAVDNAARFASTVSRLATEKGPLVVYPGGETAISALVRASARMPWQAVLPYPGMDLSVLYALRDKRELAKLAERAGFEVPATLAQGTARELASVSVPTPSVVKPARPGGGFSTARVVESREEFEALLGEVDPGTSLLVQERLRGPLVMIALVLDSNGRPAARFQQIGRRTWPATAGASSLAISMPPDESLLGSAVEMLSDAGFAGLAQLDFIQTDRGTVLIDVNPRFYTSLPLALACGLNLPAIWHAVSVGESVPPERLYRIGVAYRWLEADLLAAARGSPAVLAHRGARPRAGAMWAADDPVAGALLAVRAGAMRLQGRIARANSRDRQHAAA